MARINQSNENDVKQLERKVQEINYNMKLLKEAQNTGKLLDKPTLLMKVLDLSPNQIEQAKTQLWEIEHEQFVMVTDMIR